MPKRIPAPAPQEVTLYQTDIEDTPQYPYTRADQNPAATPERDRLMQTVTDIKHTARDLATEYDLVGLGDAGPIEYTVMQIDRDKIWLDLNLYTMTEEEALFMSDTPESYQRFKAFCDGMMHHAVIENNLIAEYNQIPIIVIDRVNPDDEDQPCMLIAGLDTFLSSGQKANDITKLNGIQRQNCSDYDVRLFGIKNKIHNSAPTKEEIFRQIYFARIDRSKGQYSSDSVDFPETREQLAQWLTVTPDYVDDLEAVYRNQQAVQLIIERKLQIGNGIAIVQRLARHPTLLPEAFEYAVTQQPTRGELLSYLRRLVTTLNLVAAPSNRQAVDAFSKVMRHHSVLVEKYGDALKQEMGSEQWEHFLNLYDQLEGMLRAVNIPSSL